jgi:hypothetical protein
MNEILSEEEFEQTLWAAVNVLNDDGPSYNKVLASHRALHSQVRELEKANISLMETINLPLNECNKRVLAAQARSTALEAEKALLQAKYEASEIDKKIHWTCDHEHWQQRVTQLAHDNAELTARTGQLEGALKPYLAIVEALEPQLIGCSREQELTYKKALKDLRQVQHALTPGVYREWCRDPKLCQDNGTCPKDPSCAD